MQAKMPQQFMARKLKDLTVGEKVYVTPMTMSVAEDRTLRLFTGSGFLELPYGSATMGVERTLDGWRCDISLCDYLWDVSHSTSGEPVTELITSKD